MTGTLPIPAWVDRSFAVTGAARQADACWYSLYSRDAEDNIFQTCIPGTETERVPPMRHVVIVGAILVSLSGCGPGREGVERIDGQDCVLEGNSFKEVDLTKDEAEWSTHLGVTLSRYAYRYEGPPVLMHVWYDVNQEGVRVGLPIVSVPLVDWARPEARVRRKGVVLISRRMLWSGADKAPDQLMTIDVRDYISHTFGLPPGREG